MKEINYTKLQNKLKENINSWGDSRKIADKTGLDYTLISRLSTGTRKPSVKTLYVLAKYFNCHMEELVEE